MNTGFAMPRFGAVYTIKPSDTARDEMHPLRLKNALSEASTELLKARKNRGTYAVSLPMRALTRPDKTPSESLETTVFTASDAIRISPLIERLNSLAATIRRASSTNSLSVMFNNHDSSLDKTVSDEGRSKIQEILLTVAKGEFVDVALEIHNHISKARVKTIDVG